MAAKRSIRIDINEKWCKKCGICIAFCPEKVFDDKGGMPVIRDLSACTGCLQCELLCPDFAIEVHITREEQA
jgi:2-oxoglutarate ferredoxin oxidoreductase subunit delta